MWVWEVDVGWGKGTFNFLQNVKKVSKGVVPFPWYYEGEATQVFLMKQKLKRTRLNPIGLLDFSRLDKQYLELIIFILMKFIPCKHEGAGLHSFRHVYA